MNSRERSVFLIESSRPFRVSFIYRNWKIISIIRLFSINYKLTISLFPEFRLRWIFRLCLRTRSTRARTLFRAVSVPCGQQGSWQYLCRRNCPPTSKGVPKRINFTPRREKGVNIWNGYPSSVTLLFGRHDRGKDLRFLLLFFSTWSHDPSISLSRV